MRIGHFIFNDDETRAIARGAPKNWWKCYLIKKKRPNGGTEEFAFIGQGTVTNDERAKDFLVGREVEMLTI